MCLLCQEFFVIAQLPFGGGSAGDNAPSFSWDSGSSVCGNWRSLHIASQAWTCSGTYFFKDPCKASGLLVSNTRLRISAAATGKQQKQPAKLNVNTCSGTQALLVPTGCDFPSLLCFITLSFCLEAVLFYRLILYTFFISRN